MTVVLVDLAGWSRTGKAPGSAPGSKTPLRRLPFDLQAGGRRGGLQQPGESEQETRLLLFW